MEERNVPAGTTLYFGAPAQPMHPSRAAAIAALVAHVPGILEAHLPQCLIEGDSAPRQVLAIVVSSKAEIPRIVDQLNAGLKPIVPGGHFIDILPFTKAAVVAGMREAKCQIYPAAV